MIRAFVVAIGVALVLGVPAAAQAKPRVAIVAFDDDNGELQDIVADLLDGQYSIVATSKVTRAMDKLGFDVDMTSKQLKKLSTELEADTIIRGEVNKRSGHRVLHLRLFHDGKKVRGFKIEFASARSQKFKDALKDKLLASLNGEAPKKPKEPDEGGGDDETKKPPKTKTPDEAGEAEAGDGKTAKGGGDEEAGKGKGKGAHEGDDGEEPDGGKQKRVAKRDDDDEEPLGAEGEVEGGAAIAGTPHTANRAAVRVDFGPSLSSRSLSFTSRSFEEAPKPYSNSPVPGARVEAELYPLAFGNPNGIVSGLGFGGDYDKTLALNLQSTVQQGTKFPVTQSHFSVGPRLRIVFGKKPTSFSATLKAGYMAREFKVDRSKLMEGNIIDLPDVGYKGFSGGLDLRIPVARSVALIAGGGAIFVTTTGAIQTASQYGQAKVTGAEGKLGVDISIGNRIGVKIMGEGCQMGFAFTGTGELARNRDGDPMTKDVGGAADRYLGGSLTLGVLY